MKLIGWFVLVVILNGCALWRPEKALSRQTLQSKYTFDYTVTNGAAISLVQVFDDSGSTYFQFRSAPPEVLVVTAETKSGDAVIPHEVMGNFAVLRGVYRRSHIASAVQPVIARKLGQIMPMADFGPVILPQPVKPTTTTVEQQTVPAISREPFVQPLTTHMIRFARNTSHVGPTGKGDLKAVLTEARRSSQVEIRVRPFYPARQASIRLAEARAKMLRDALVAGGIDGASIRIDNLGAAHALIAEVVLRFAEQHTEGQPTTVAAVAKRGPASAVEGVFGGAPTFGNRFSQGAS